MSLDQTLRPESTHSRTEQINRLLNKGYHPINILPRDSLLRIPTQEGPTLLSIPKVKVGTLAEPNAPTTQSGGTCTWGPVVYLVAWKTAVRKGEHTYSMKLFAEDIRRFKHSPTLQESLLCMYLVAHIESDPAKATLRPAIDAALRLLQADRGKLEP